MFICVAIIWIHIMLKGNPRSTAQPRCKCAMQFKTWESKTKWNMSTRWEQKNNTWGYNSLGLVTFECWAFTNSARLNNVTMTRQPCENSWDEWPVTLVCNQYHMACRAPWIDENLPRSGVWHEDRYRSFITSFSYLSNQIGGWPNRRCQVGLQPVQDWSD